MSTVSRAPRTCETLIKGIVLTVDRDRRVFDKGYVAITAGRITDVGPIDSCDWVATRETVDGDFLVMPGLINTHSHLLQGTIRGMGAGTSYEERLYGIYYPMMAACNEEEAYISALCSLLEMFTGGVTTTQDAHFCNVNKSAIDGVLRAVSDLGMRCRMTRNVLTDPATSPAGFQETPDVAIGEVERVKRQWESETIRVTTAPLGLTYVLFDHVKPLFDWTEANRTQFDLHTTTFMDNKLLAERGWKGGSAHQWLDAHDMLNERSLLLTGGEVPEEDFDVIARANARVSLHADHARIKSELRPLLERGVRVGIGLDGAVGGHQNFWYLIRHAVPNQRHADRLADMSPASDPMDTRYVAKSLFGDPETAIELGTIGGASALDWEEQIGSLEVGKFADLVVFDLSHAVQFAPRAALVNILVAASANNARYVKHVYVGGRKVIDDGTVVGVDVEKIIATANKQQTRQLEETGAIKWLKKQRGRWNWIDSSEAEPAAGGARMVTN